MPIRFAAPACSRFSRMPPGAAWAWSRVPANDDEARMGGDDALHAALRHFAEHGLAAAQQARREAERARTEGDEQSYAWWLGICRALDRRLARELDRRTGSD